MFVAAPWVGTKLADVGVRELSGRDGTSWDLGLEAEALSLLVSTAPQHFLAP